MTARCFSCLIFLLSGACASQPANPFDSDLQPGGVDMTTPPVPLVAARPYQVELPDSDMRPAPLVVVLHGYGANGIAQDAYFGFSPYGRKQGVITAYPDGTKNSEGKRFWNATDQCCDFEHTNIDDVAYLSAVIDDAIQRYGADPQRVYLLGHSNGGFMAYRMACDQARKIAAIATLAGANWLDQSKCQPAAEVAVLQIHGTQDESVPYAGLPNALPSAIASVGAFAKRDGCSEAPDAAMPIDLVSDLPADKDQAPTETQVLRWSGCRKAGAALWTIQGGTHLPRLTPTFAPQVYGFLSQYQR